MARRLLGDAKFVGTGPTNLREPGAFDDKGAIMFIKRFCGPLLLQLLLAGPALAMPVPCQTLVTFQDYLDQSPSGGCYIADKLFTGFAYAGGGAITAEDVRVIALQFTAPGFEADSLLFMPIGAGTWTSSFSIGYKIEIDPPAPGTSITAASLFGNFGPPGNPAFASSVKSNGATLEIGLGIATDSAAFAGVQSLESSTEVTIPTGGLLISLEERYEQTSLPVPEPATTWLMLAGGLLLLARGWFSGDPG